MTLKEYLEDYASPVTKAVGEKLLPIEIAKIKDDKIRTIVEENLIKIHIHTMFPYKLLELGQKCGEFERIKIENMTLQ